MRDLRLSSQPQRITAHCKQKSAGIETWEFEEHGWTKLNWTEADGVRSRTKRTSRVGLRWNDWGRYCEFCGQRWKKHEWVLNEAGVRKELLKTAKAEKLSYNDHTTRKQGSCLEKEITQGTMPGARRRKRPRTAWMDNSKTWTGLTMDESIRMTEDRDKWRKYVHGVANRRIEDGWRTEQIRVDHHSYPLLTSPIIRNSLTLSFPASPICFATFLHRGLPPYSKLIPHMDSCPEFFHFFFSVCRVSAI